jgi:hypothetical protein
MEEWLKSVSMLLAAIEFPGTSLISAGLNAIDMNW